MLETDLGSGSSKWKRKLDVEVGGGSGRGRRLLKEAGRKVDQWRCYIQARPTIVRRDTSDSGILGNDMIRDGMTRCEERSQNAEMEALTSERPEISLTILRYTNQRRGPYRWI